MRTLGNSESFSEFSFLVVSTESSPVSMCRVYSVDLIIYGIMRVTDTSTTIDADGVVIGRPAMGSGTYKKWLATIQSGRHEPDKIYERFKVAAEKLLVEQRLLYVFVGEDEQSQANKDRELSDPETWWYQKHNHVVVHFAERVGLRYIAKHLTDAMDMEFGGENGGIRWLVQKGTDEQAIGYAKKYDDSREKWSMGIIPDPKQGKRSDIDLFKDKVMNGVIKCYDDALDEASSLCVRSKQFVLDYLAKHGDPPARMPAGTVLRVWQHLLVEFLKSPPDDRTVIFFVDRIGNSGKSWFTRYAGELCAPKFVNVIPPGRAQDTCTQVDVRADIIIMDIPREITADPEKKRVQYHVFEQIKNRRVFDSKFQSRTKILKEEGVHLIVFTNEFPVYDGTLSEDRFKVYEITSTMNRPFEPPSVPTFGTEFSSDNSGDGPISLADLDVIFEEAKRPNRNVNVVEPEPDVTSAVRVVENKYGDEDSLLPLHSTGHKFWLLGANPGTRTPIDRPFVCSTNVNHGVNDYARNNLNWHGEGSLSITFDLSKWPTEDRVFKSRVDMMTGHFMDDPSYMDASGAVWRLKHTWEDTDEHMCFGNDHALQQLHRNFQGNPLAEWKRVACRDLPDSNLLLYKMCLRRVKASDIVVKYDVIDYDGNVSNTVIM